MSDFLKEGDMFLDYRLLDEIGRGGMGIVFKAVQEEFGDYVAIKFLAPRHTKRQDFVARFAQECRIYPMLKHANIVRMRRAGVEQLVVPVTRSEAPPRPVPVPYVVMDLLVGKTLRRILQRYRRLDFLNALYVMMQVADALRVAHGKRVVHRDLKPENIMVGSDGEEKGWVWLMDFGIAQIAEGGISTDEMPDMGTARYMAPEQVRNVFNAGRKGKRASLDRRIDIYAFGIIFYELITGVHTFINDNDPPSFEETLAGHLAAEPTPVHHLVFDCPETLWPILERCLAVDPSLRYPSFDEVLADLRALIRESVPPMHPLAKRVVAEKERVAARTAFASLPERDKPSDEVSRNDAPALERADCPRGEALPSEPLEPPDRVALTPEPPAPVVLDVSVPGAAEPPEARAALPMALAPTVPAEPTRVEAAPEPIDVPRAGEGVSMVRIEEPASSDAPAADTDVVPFEATHPDAEPEPPARLTMPLLDYVPKQNPLPFVPAAAPFVPSVPLLPSKRGVGYTAQMPRAELPDRGAPPATSTAAPSSVAPPSTASLSAASPSAALLRKGVGYTTKIERAQVGDMGAPSPPRPASAGTEKTTGASARSGWPYAASSANAAFSLPAPALPTWGPVAAPAAPAGVAGTHAVARFSPTFGPPPPLPPSPAAPPATSKTTGGDLGVGSRSAAGAGRPPGLDRGQINEVPRLPGTPANMTTPARPTPRRRLFLAPLLGFVIVAVASAAFLLVGPRARSSTAPPTAVAAGPGTATAAADAPEALPDAPLPAPATSTAASATAEPTTGPSPVPPSTSAPPTPAASTHATSASPAAKPPKPARPSSGARTSPSRTPVTPLVGD